MDRVETKHILIRMLYPLNSKKILFLAIGLLFLSVLLFTEWPLISNNNDARKRLVGMSWLLIPHVAFSLIALVMGPFQFSVQLRQHKPMLHRKLGVAYVISVLSGAILAFIISQKFPFPGTTFILNAAIVTQAALWFITTFIAYVFARKRQIFYHKVWMGRSYGIATTFIFTRAPNPILAFAHIGNDGFSLYLFLLLFSALLVPELLLNRNHALGNKKKSNKHAVSPADESEAYVDYYGA